MSKIKDILLSLIKNNDLIGHMSGYVESRIALLKIEIKEEIIEGISRSFVYIVIIIISGCFIFFFSIGVALYISTFFDEPYMGYWIVATFYFLAFLSVLIMKKKIQKCIMMTIKKKGD